MGFRQISLCICSLKLRKAIRLPRGELLYRDWQRSDLSCHTHISELESRFTPHTAHTHRPQISFGMSAGLTNTWTAAL